MRPWAAASLLAGCLACAGEAGAPRLVLEKTWPIDSPLRCGARSVPAMLTGGGPGEGLALACVRENGEVALALSSREDSGFDGASWYAIAADPRADRPRMAGTAGHLAYAVGVDATARGVTADGSVSGPWVAALTAGSRPLGHDGRWLLARTGWSGLELRDIEDPGLIYSHDSLRHVLRAVAVPGGFVVFTGGIAGERPGWIEVRPGEPPTFERTVQDLVGEVFDAHAASGELVVGAWTGTSDRSRVRVMRLALDGGRPMWPPLASLELRDYVRVDGPVHLAWDGEGVGFIVQFGVKADPAPCAWSTLGTDCRLATGPTAHVLRVDGDGLSAEPVLLPYLEYEPALHEASNRPAPVLAARAGRLLALQGPPYVVAAYAVEPRWPDSSRLRLEAGPRASRKSRSY